MTTIVANLEMIVTDSNISDGEQHWSSDKAFEHAGTIYATCGDLVDGEKFMRWMKKDCKGRKPRLNVKEFNALALNKTGLYWLDSKLYPVQVEAPFAIGSGATAALAAMLAGAPIEVAVELACTVDDGSALPVRVHKLADVVGDTLKP